MIIIITSNNKKTTCKLRFRLINHYIFLVVLASVWSYAFHIICSSDSQKIFVFSFAKSLKDIILTLVIAIGKPKAKKGKFSWSDTSNE